MAYKEKCTFNLEIDISNLAILSIYCVIYEKTGHLTTKKFENFISTEKSIGRWMDKHTHTRPHTPSSIKDNDIKARVY